MRATILLSAALLSVSCAQSKAQDFGATTAQELIDSSRDLGLISAEYIAAIKIADENATPDQNASDLADELNAAFLACGAFATATGASVAIQWDASGAPCELGAGPQGVSASGTHNVTITINAGTVDFAFDGLLSISGASVDETTTLTVDPLASSATLARAATITIGETILDTQTNGTVTFDNSGSGSDKLSFEITRALNAGESQQAWAGLIAQQGVRLPLEGSTTVTTDNDKLSATATISNDGASAVSLAETVTRKGKTFDFTFTVDVANGDTATLVE